MIFSVLCHVFSMMISFVFQEIVSLATDQFVGTQPPKPPVMQNAAELLANGTAVKGAPRHS